MNTATSAGRAGQGVVGSLFGWFGTETSNAWNSDSIYSYCSIASSVISPDRLAYEVAQKNSEEIAGGMDYRRILWFMVPPYKKL